MQDNRDGQIRAALGKVFHIQTGSHVVPHGNGRESLGRRTAYFKFPTGHKLLHIGTSAYPENQALFN
jgi:hypothetical protein